MIKAILFDLDGTLVDTNNLIIQSFKHTFKKELNLDVDEAEIVMYFGEPLKYTLAKYGEENLDKLMNTYRSYNETMHDELACAVESADNALKALKASGIKVGVVTSKRRNMAERSLKLFNILDQMDIIVTPEDTEKHKPEGEPVLKACEILGIKPSEAIMVGDSYFDILCGKNAGAKTCLVKYTALPMEELLKYEPDYIIDDLNDLIKLL